MIPRAKSLPTVHPADAKGIGTPGSAGEKRSLCSPHVNCYKNVNIGTLPSWCICSAKRNLPSALALLAAIPAMAAPPTEETILLIDPTWSSAAAPSSSMWRITTPTRRSPWAR
jgi:hypothetical protein